MNFDRVARISLCVLVTLTVGSLGIRTLAQSTSDLRAMQWWLQTLGVPATGPRTAIGIVDSGCSPRMDPTGQLASCIRWGWNYALNNSDYSDGESPQTGAHGTEMAGIAGAGQVGAFPGNVNLAIGRDVDDQGNTTVHWQCLAMRGLVDQGAGVISISQNLGYPTTSERQELSTTVDYLESKGVPLFVACGNDSKDRDTDPDEWNWLPQSNVYRSAATTREDTLTSISAFGLGRVEGAAPASEFLLVGSTANSYTWAVGGTSESTIITASLAALLLDQVSEGKMTWDQVIPTIMGTSDRVPGLAGKVFSGGRINFARALSANLNTPLDSLGVSVKRKSAKLVVSGTETPNASVEFAVILRIWVGGRLAGLCSPGTEGAFRFVAKGEFQRNTVLNVQSSLGAEATSD